MAKARSLVGLDVHATKIVAAVRATRVSGCLPPSHRGAGDVSGRAVERRCFVVVWYAGQSAAGIGAARLGGAWLRPVSRTVMLSRASVSPVSGVVVPAWMMWGTPW
jgi:hypothetical protein